MKKFSVLLMTMFFMVLAIPSGFAQEITITLVPGWNWISYPNAEVMDVTSALGDFTPVQGDMIKSQSGNISYINGQWRGSMEQFTPGRGYMYYSNRTEMVSFVFAGTTPQMTVTTSEPTNITTTSAVVGGTVTMEMGNHIFARGICWGTEQMPTIDGNHIQGESVVGSINDTLMNLIPNTTYYVRAYMVSDQGLAYAEEVSFTTLQGVPIGAISGVFSASASQQVYFSQGNLQYQASTNTWQFAEQQYDYVGSDNSNISQTYDGWIDLFGWGTSGWNCGNTYYQPWNSVNYNECNWGTMYGPLGHYNLNGTYANSDWGVYNPISNGGNQPNVWRTLTKNEWDYVFNLRRTASGIRYAKARVNNVNGVILLPDDWNANTYNLSNTNISDANYDSNVITTEEWHTLEQQGAVFLPTAGSRMGTSVNNMVYYGNYWSSSYYSTNLSHELVFHSSYLETQGIEYRSTGNSVRLVHSITGPLPEVSTLAPTNINATTATVSGIVSDDGGTEITECGMCWSIEQSPVIAGNHLEVEGVIFGEFTLVLTNLIPNTTYYVRAYAVSDHGVAYGEEEIFTTLPEHDFVDLGLPSGTLWATYNIGANSPEDYGDYFAWGEIQTKDFFYWDTYQYCNGNDTSFTKYCSDPYYGYNGFTDYLNTLQPEDDAATANWGEDWRTPSYGDWLDLFHYTSHTWTTLNGVYGYLFTGSNGNSIFLPAAGYYTWEINWSLGEEGCYWSNSLDYYNVDFAKTIVFNSSSYYLQSSYGRYCGLPVRAVRVQQD